MKFDASKLAEFIRGHNSRGNLKEFQQDVLDVIEAEDYTIAVHELVQCRLPLGIAALESLMEGDTKSAATELHRLWRYFGYAAFIELKEADWIRAELDAGRDPGFEIPKLFSKNAAYALALGMIFDEVDFVHWLGKRTLGAFLAPDTFGPILWQDEPVVPCVLGLFAYWIRWQAADPQAELIAPIDQLAACCKDPYPGKVLTDWDQPSFEKGFGRMCDRWGDKNDEPLPFNGIPVAILAAVGIRQKTGLSVPAHPLLEEPVAQLPLMNSVRSKDPFFEQVVAGMDEITPTDDYHWKWG